LLRWNDGTDRRIGKDDDTAWEESPFFRSLVFLQEAENLRGNGWGLEHPGHRCSGWPNLKGKGMEGQTGEAHLLAEELERPSGAVARIAHHGMAGKPGVAPDLMLAAGQKVALNEGVMGAPAENPETGFAQGHPARPFGMEAAPRLF
jgi:hypothetical protein